MTPRAAASLSTSIGLSFSLGRGCPELQEHPHRRTCQEPCSFSWQVRIGRRSSWSCGHARRSTHPTGSGSPMSCTDPRPPRRRSWRSTTGPCRCRSSPTSSSGPSATPTPTTPRRSSTGSPPGDPSTSPLRSGWLRQAPSMTAGRTTTPSGSRHDSISSACTSSTRRARSGGCRSGPPAGASRSSRPSPTSPTTLVGSATPPPTTTSRPSPTPQARPGTESGSIRAARPPRRAADRCGPSSRSSTRCAAAPHRSPCSSSTTTPVPSRTSRRPAGPPRHARSPRCTPGTSGSGTASTAAAGSPLSPDARPGPHVAARTPTTVPRRAPTPTRAGAATTRPRQGLTRQSRSNVRSRPTGQSSSPEVFRKWIASAPPGQLPRRWPRGAPSLIARREGPPPARTHPRAMPGAMAPSEPNRPCRVDRLPPLASSSA
ncbi:Basic proline-rich protein precursor [Euzebya pacifica]|uniref:Basic proline-rich protein n=1 Tax=Euzebya pacifica TaxID=1608957 RepID=A0A346XU88_9ACTN|nr:Basic proline-rich protein precursor [Euzebya pacifica]